MSVNLKKVSINLADPDCPAIFLDDRTAPKVALFLEKEFVSARLRDILEILMNITLNPEQLKLIEAQLARAAV